MINNILILSNEKILLMFNRKTASLSILSFVINTLGYNKPDSDIFFKDKNLDDFLDYKKVVIVRDPFSRILSGYNDDLGFGIISNSFIRYKNIINKDRDQLKIERRERRERRDILDKSQRELTFEEYVNMICSIPDDKANQHFKSQTYIFKPDIIIKLEDMIGWSELGLPEIPHSHKSRNKIVTEITEDLKIKIKERYKNDFDILGY